MIYEFIGLGVVFVTITAAVAVIINVALFLMDAACGLKPWREEPSDGR